MGSRYSMAQPFIKSTITSPANYSRLQIPIIQYYYWYYDYTYLDSMVSYDMNFVWSLFEKQIGRFIAELQNY